MLSLNRFVILGFAAVPVALAAPEFVSHLYGDDAQVSGTRAAAIVEAAQALVTLGKKADSPDAERGQPASAAEILTTARKLRALPAEDRYLLLKYWTLPSGDRQSARLLCRFAPTDGPSPEFEALRYNDLAPDNVLSTAALLIDAARDAGKLDELAEELDEAALLYGGNAEVLWILTEIARGKGADVREAVADLAARLPERLAQTNTEPFFQPVAWSDHLVARACCSDDALRDLGRNLARVLAYYPNRRWSNLQDALVTLALRELIELEGTAPEPGLALWHRVSHLDSVVHRTGWVPPYWVVRDDEIRHLVGPQYDLLYFAYPLSGNFEFSVDTYTFRQAARGYVAESTFYGDLCYGALHSGREMVWVVGLQDRVFPTRPVPDQEGYYRATVQVEPGAIRFMQNGQPYYEEIDASPTSPWLALCGWRTSQGRFRNLELKGSPTIPREVRLTHENRLDGWISSFYLETQPRQPRNAEHRPQLNIMPWATPEYSDWYADSGVIHGRRRSVAPDEDKGEIEQQLFYQRAERAEVARACDQKPIQSRLYYHRPLRDGDRLSYEFFYEPDKIEVHPSLGRLTFLLQPDGVRLHWITDTPFDDPTGLAHDNVVDVPQDCRGPQPVPLKPGEWNQATISLADDTAILALNGVEVYERKLQGTNGSFFGLFHWKDRTAVQVRNVVLTGDWPEKLSEEMMANLLARSGEIGDAER